MKEDYWNERAKKMKGVAAVNGDPIAEELELNIRGYAPEMLFILKKRKDVR